MGLARVLGIAACAMSASAWATPQCPEAFGEKSPLVNASGWGVLALGIVAGVALMAFIVVRSRRRRRRWPARLAAWLGGAIAMLAIAVGGLVVAVSAFFLRC